MTTTEEPRTEDRSKRTTLWYDLVLDDEHLLPEYLRARHHHEPRSTSVPVTRYTSRDYHLLEREHLWRKVWQMACRVENIPDVGSYIVYEIAGDSYLVVQYQERHQGVRQRLPAPRPRTEGLRRALQRVPLQLPRVHLASRRHAALPAGTGGVPRRRGRPRRLAACPRRRSAVWGGFVFINPDPDCEPLEHFLGTLPEHFARWDFEHRYLSAHVAKKLRCNWKIAQEAFDEGLHLGATHPQSAPYVGDVNAAVDVYGNYSRQISPSGTPIEDMPLDATETEILKRMLDVREGEDLPIPFSQDAARRATRMAAAGRDRWRSVLGDEADTVSDAELVDHWNYAVFPNLHPWGGYNRIVYRFRPNGDRHDESIFEVMFLTPFRGARPPTAPITHLDFDDDWTDAPELHTLALVMQQDSFNMEAVQRGLQTTRRTAVTLSTFQEGMVAWRHDLLTEWVDDPAREAGS